MWQVSDALDAMLKRRAACVARHAHDPGLHAPPWFIIVDLRACKGCDFGGAQELIKLAALVQGRGGQLRVAQPLMHVGDALTIASGGQFGPSFLSFDEELRRAEDSILAVHGGGTLPSLESFPVTSQLAEYVRRGFDKTVPVTALRLDCDGALRTPEDPP